MQCAGKYTPRQACQNTFRKAHTLRCTLDIVPTFMGAHTPNSLAFKGPGNYPPCDRALEKKNE